MDIPLKKNDEYGEFNYPQFVKTFITILNTWQEHPCYFFWRNYNLPSNGFHIEYAENEPCMIIVFGNDVTAIAAVSYLKSKLPDNIAHNIRSADALTVVDDKKLSNWAFKIVIDNQELVTEWIHHGTKESTVSASDKTEDSAKTGFFPDLRELDSIEGYVKTARDLLKENGILAWGVIQGDYTFTKVLRYDAKAEVFQFHDQVAAKKAWDIIQSGLNRPVLLLDKLNVVILFDVTWAKIHEVDLLQALESLYAPNHVHSRQAAEEASSQAVPVPEEIESIQKLTLAERDKQSKDFRTALKALKMRGSSNRLKPDDIASYYYNVYPAEGRPYDLFIFKDKVLFEKAEILLKKDFSAISYKTSGLAIFFIADPNKFDSFDEAKLASIIIGK